MVRLPLVATHAKEHTYCAYCPKMCRFSCPVSTVQGRESTTPWGKMTSLHHVSRGALPMSESVAATWYACTGCMRCRTFCAHHNEVGPTLFAARSEAVKSGHAPAVARDVIARFAARKERAVASATRHFGSHLSTRSEVAFVPGCTAAATAPEDSKAVHAALEKVLGRAVRVSAAGCCGLPLFEAGDHAGGMEALRAFSADLRGATTAIFQDPGCLYAAKVLGESYGVSLGLEAVHVSETLARSRDRLRPIELGERVRYHDACRLGRGLGVYEPPRDVLAKMLGRPVEEFAQNRDKTECVGGGGQLPRTDRVTADGIAHDRAADHKEQGGGVVVTACPAARRRWASAGVVSHDLSVIAARACLGQ